MTNFIRKKECSDQIITSHQNIQYSLYEKINSSMKKSSKNRIIVNFQKLNKIIKSDIYFISLQTNMINVIAECLYVFMINAVFFFINDMFFSLISKDSQ